MNTIDEYLIEMEMLDHSKSAQDNIRVALCDLAAFKLFLESNEDNYEDFIRQYDGLKPKAKIKIFDKHKSLEHVTKNDINRFFVELNKIKKPATVNIKKIYIKQFFTTNDKLDLVKHIKIKNVKRELDSSSILNVNDINKLILAADSMMYKAIISVLWETGGRINEVLLIMKEKDLVETPDGYICTLHTSKTSAGMRRMMLIDSAPYIRQYLLYSNKPDPRLFPIKRSAVYNRLQEIKKSANVNKPVNPHAFRHGQATAMVRQDYQESIIRKKFGWTGDSKMIDRYIHANDQDVINAQLKKAGILTDEDEGEEIDIVQPEDSIIGEIQTRNKDMFNMMLKMSGCLSAELGQKFLQELEAKKKKIVTHS